MHEFDNPLNLEAHHIGPAISEGATKTLLYFSLCSKESLSLSPFNQPAIFAKEQGYRVFSITMPGHGDDFNKYKAIEYWANNVSKLKNFIKKMHQFVDYLDEKTLIDFDQFFISGLSRGAFIATHLLTHPKVKYACNFAPVTDLSCLKEFKEIDLTEHHDLNLFKKLNILKNKKMISYIGNRDERVSTKRCFELTSELSELAYQNKIRNPPFEMVISPSTGFDGHGTLPDTFESGINWLEKHIVR